MKKKGMFFSTDAIIALSIVLLVIIIAYPIAMQVNKNYKIHYDVIQTLSSLQIGEINNSYVQSLIDSGQITDFNKSVLEQIGEFSVTNKTLAQNLASSVLQDLPSDQNIGIWFGPQIVYTKNRTAYEDSVNVDTARQIISGVKEGQSLTGFSARAYLTNSLQSKYVYFGGYVGDGNITIILPYSGNISLAKIELAINGDFILYVNNISQGNYQGSTDEFTPVNYTIPINNFRSGSNTIGLSGNNLHIAGGFIRIDYNPDVLYQQPTRYYFPGISGLINVYDGIYIPNNLNSMNIFLHYNTNYSIFLTIGNTTVFNGSSSGQATQSINNSYLSSILNYNYLSNKTVPIRLGLQNLSSATNFSGNADVILITDNSGSMAWRMDSDSSGTLRNCNNSLINDPSTARISVAKCIDADFVATILSGSGNRVGLVSFSTSADSYVNLTTNQALLNSSINSYTASGSTCISCAINQAYSILQSGSNSSRNKYVIVMTDGVPNQRSASMCYDANSISSKNPFAAQVGDSGYISIFNSAWQLQNSGTSTNLNGIDVYNSTLAFAVGDSYQIFRYLNGAWSFQQDLGSQNLKSISIYNSTLAFAVGDSGKIAIWNGLVWSEYTDIGSINLRAIKIFNNTLAFAVGDSGYIYRWNGVSWLQDTDVGTSNLYGVDTYSSTLAFSVGSSGKIYRWNGVSWLQDTDLGSMTLRAIKIFNNTLAFAVSDNNQIYRWNGVSWSNAYSGSYPLYGITILNSSLGYAVGNSRGGLVMWNGNSWQQAFPPYYYSGNLTSGLNCNDNDVCSLSQSIPMLNSNYSSCRLHNDLNATVNSVGFGPFTSCNFAVKTLQEVAGCGNGSFYASSNSTLLQQFYQTIAQSILQISYSEQTSQAVGNVTTILYPDSYIEYNYTANSNPFGLILSLESQFSNSTTGNFSLPQNTTIVNAQVTSYSGAKWTDNVKINGFLAYNLSQYGSAYARLGDPYVISIPSSYVNSSNSIKLITGVAPANTSSGSQYNKIIYTVTKNVSSFSGILAKSEGCAWSIQFEDNFNATMLIPANYSGSNQCAYNPSQAVYDTNDAYQMAAYNLLKSLDLDSDSRVDIKFSDNNLQISSTKFTGIPYTWSTEVQVRIWS